MLSYVNIYLKNFLFEELLKVIVLYCFVLYVIFVQCTRTRTCTHKNVFVLVLRFYQCTRTHTRTCTQG